VLVYAGVLWCALVNSELPSSIFYLPTSAHIVRYAILFCAFSVPATRNSQRLCRFILLIGHPSSACSSYSRFICVRQGQKHPRRSSIYHLIIFIFTGVVFVSSHHHLYRRQVYWIAFDYLFIYPPTTLIYFV
jgi:hypothetical protein